MNTHNINILFRARGKLHHRNPLFYKIINKIDSKVLNSDIEVHIHLRESMKREGKSSRT